MKRKHKKSKGLSSSQLSSSSSVSPITPTAISISTCSTENQSPANSPTPATRTTAAAFSATSHLNISYIGTSHSTTNSNSSVDKRIKVDAKSHLGIIEYDCETDLTTVCSTALAAGDSSLHLNPSETREHLLETLIDTGMVAVMKKYISHRLRFSGWTTTLNEECIEYMKEKGVDNVNVSHMMCDLIPFARELVPTDVRSEIKEILKSFALAHVTVDDTLDSSEDLEYETSDINLPFEYQPRDTKPNPGNGLIFNQPFPSPSGSPPYSMHSPPPHMYSPPHYCHSPVHSSSGSSSISNLPQHSPKDSGHGLGSPFGGVVLLDRLLDKEIEPKEPPNKEKIVIVIPKDQEKPAVIHREPAQATVTATSTATTSIPEVSPKDHHHHHQHHATHVHTHSHPHHHMRNKRLDKEERDKKEREEQRLLYQQLSKPTSPITPIISASSLRSGDKKLLMEAVQPISTKPVPPITPAALLSTSSTITSSASNVGVTSSTIGISPSKQVKQPKHILNSDNDDDDEDDEELLDI